MRVSIKQRLFLTHFIAVVLVSGSIGSFFYWNASDTLLESLKLRLKSTSAMISRALSAKDLDEILGPEDMDAPGYKRTLELLREFRMTNPDIAYLYVMRRHGGEVSFVVDSDETENQAKPGDVYEDAPDTLLAGFIGPSVDDQLYKDDWGEFLSGYSPLPEGQGNYLVGMDMRAGQVAKKFKSLRSSGLVSLGASLILAYVFSMLLANHFTTPVRLLVARCQAIAEGRLDEEVHLRTRDELDSLIGAFNIMSSRLSQAREHSVEAQHQLIRSRDELEVRVEERTRELRELNERLQHEIEQRRRAEEALKQMASSDPLTGLLNRRAMVARLEQEFARVQRQDGDVSLLLLDLDHFKNVNDGWGHAVGDQVLQETSKRLVDLLRRQDVVSRWGGEEFLILLPDTKEAGALVLAEKLREHIANTPYETAKASLAVTASVGVASMNGHGDIDRAVEAADMAMYQAKVKGRNRVETL